MLAIPYFLFLCGLLVEIVILAALLIWFYVLLTPEKRTEAKHSKTAVNAKKRYIQSQRNGISMVINTPPIDAKPAEPRTDEGKAWVRDRLALNKALGDNDYVRAAMSTWFTLAATSGYEPDIYDILNIRDWIDGGLVGPMPEPKKKEFFDV